MLIDSKKVYIQYELYSILDQNYLGNLKWFILPSSGYHGIGHTCDQEDINVSDELQSYIYTNDLSYIMLNWF